jgi:hypothetical protein
VVTEITKKKRDYGYGEELQEVETRLRDALSIDRSDLDTAISRQPSLYMDASDLVSTCSSKRDHFKNELARIEAEVAQEIRNGEKKQTDASVKEQVPLDSVVIDTKKFLNYWHDKTTIAYALRDSIDQRGKMLRELVGLYVAGYYQNSSVNAAAHKVRDFEAEQGKRAMQRARLSRKSV